VSIRWHNTEKIIDLRNKKKNLKEIKSQKKAPPIMGEAVIYA
jgi:hypothetical protein